MLGLIYKDLLVMKKEILLNFLVIVGWSIPMFMPWSDLMYDVDNTSIYSSNTMSYIIMPIVSYFFMFTIIGGLQNNLFAHDEKKCYSSWVQSTAMTVKGQVLSKYYASLMFAFGGLIWAFVCDIIASFVNGTVGSTMGIAITMFFLQMFITCFDLPFLIRFGSKNGVTFKVILLVVVFFAVIVYGLFGPLPDGGLDSFLWNAVEWMADGRKMGTIMLGFVSLAPFVVGLLYYISYRVSVKLYPKGVENYEH